MIKVKLLSKKDNWPGIIPPYCEWFETAWRENGGKCRRNFLPRVLRGAAMKTGLVVSSKKFKAPHKSLFYFGSCYPDTGVFPFQYRYEIVPFLIDTWPNWWSRLFRFIRCNNVRLLFVSQKQMCQEITERFSDICVFYIPEGVATNAYSRGNVLSERHIDVLELGRRHDPTHERICQAKIKGLKVHIFQKHKLCFPDQTTLVNGLADTKIAICWPQNFTHPERAGEIETLTLRYWEMMLSRVVMVGKAPQELIDLIGFNPVIESTPDRVHRQIETILSSIEDYQPMAETNYQAALKYGGWDDRVKKIQQILIEHGYLM